MYYACLPFLFVSADFEDYQQTFSVVDLYWDIMQDLAYFVTFSQHA